MKRLLDEFTRVFDLDHRVHGIRLGDLVEQAIDRLEDQALPDWGSPGPADRYESENAPSRDFYYAPHLFPEMELSLRLAHKLQFHMLPREVPPGAPMSIAAVLESYCHLSGDLFGWEMLADGRLLLWIVDLSGHGVRTGLASAVLKVLIDNVRRRGHVDSLAAELNETFIGCLREDKDNLFATGFFVAVSRDGTASFTSAGHPPMFLRRHDGRIEELRSIGIPIGMFPGSVYKPAEVRIEPGDAMLLYTDGLVEATNESGEEFGLDRIREFFGSQTGTPRSLTRSLYEKIAEHQDMAKLDDDVTFVVAHMESRGSS